MLFKTIRNDVYYESTEVSSSFSKNTERVSRLKNMRQEDTESALLITYKIVHYIHIFSGYKINSMIVEFMQDEYKNLWLSNCYYISSQKIEGMTEIEAIYLKRMSKFVGTSFSHETRQKRSKTVIPFKTNSRKESQSVSPKIGLQMRMSVENDSVKNIKRDKKIKFQNLSDIFANSPNEASERNWKKKSLNQEFNAINRTSSILINFNGYKEMKEKKNKKILVKLKIH